MKADGTIVIDTSIEKDGFVAGTEELEKSARRTSQKVIGIGKTIRVSLQKQADAFAKLNKQYAQQEQKVVDLEQEIQKLGEQKIETDAYKELTGNLNGVNMTMSELDAEMEKVIQKQQQWISIGVPENEAYSAVKKELDEISAAMDEVIAKQENLKRAGKAYASPLETEEYKAVESRLTSEREKLLQMHTQLGTSYDSLKAKVSEYQKRILKLAKVKQKLTAAFGKVTGAIKKFVGYIGRGISALARMNKSVDKNRMSLSRMLATSLLFSSVFRIISAVTSGIGEGMSNLAQYSDETNQSISSLMSALTRLKNSFATAFAPLLSVVVPALTTFINAISQAITYVGMLIAALTGQDSFVKAVGVQEDYTGSLEDTSSAAQDAEKSLNGYLSPLDKINRYEDGSSSGGSGSGIPGYTAPTPGDMFETVTIESSIKNLADKMKKLVQAQDWEGLGKYIASGLNKGLQKVYDVINWNNVGPKITAFVDAFTRTFNSLVDNLDWELLGRTIGTGINTVVKTLNLLIEGIDWQNLGKKVADGVYGLFDEINWTELGNLIGNKFMILWNFLYGFVSNLKWEQIGKAVGDAINGAFAKINFETIGSTLAKIFNGAFEFLKNATKTIKWKEIADNVSAGINKALKEIKPAEAGKALSDFITSLLGMLLDIVRQTDWEEVGRSIGEFLGNIDWGKIISQIGAIIWEAFSGMIAGLFDTSGGKVVLAFVAGMTAIKGTFSLLTGSAGTLVTGVGKILMKLIKFMGPKGLIVAAVIAGVALIVANWDSIKKAASDLAGWIGDRMSDIGKGISNVWNGITKQLGRTWDNIKKNAKSMVEGVKSVVQKGWNAAKTVTSTVWNGIQSGLSSIWNGIKTVAGNAVNGVKTTVQNGWNNIKSTTSSVWNGIKSTLTSTWNSLKTTASNSFNGLKNTFSNIWNGIKGVTASAWSGISKSLSSIWSGIRSTASSAFSGITSVISGAWNSVKRTTSNIWNGIYSTVSSIWSKITGALSRIGSGIKSTFSGSSYSRSVVMRSSLAAQPIPYLATGAVIPPNAPFVAMLGDQKSGNNIEAPESLLRKIVREESEKNVNKGGNYRFTAQINRRTLFDEMLSEAKMRRIQTGQNPFEAI